ncbi:hypothetical protein I306_02023 [Cryptococcus gattii EJB2]|uniref:Uncharacterized protein n=1 Tax=Cryptococcus gattii EJB2 TaxID=1296103 RepID=A0ABR5BZ36_9TREE|nr:hypothetical protein I306_02023 [Cryptococcus gattii EJB2]KJD99474.1 hypothetical protein I311_06959 [Cryptococcus gattii NT-10]
MGPILISGKPLLSRTTLLPLPPPPLKSSPPLAAGHPTNNLHSQVSNVSSPLPPLLLLPIGGQHRTIQLTDRRTTRFKMVRRVGSTEAFK